MRAVAMLSLLGAAAAAAQTLTQDDFFDDKVVQEVRLTLRPADWATLKRNYTTNDYYVAEFEWRGMKVSGIGIRSRGTGSRSPIKPGIHVHFNKYDDISFLGLHAVELKNMSQDASMLKDRIAMGFFRRMGLPASRETHARVFVNGEYVGLFAVVESINKEYLRRNFGEDNGYLYENKFVYPGYFFEYPIPAGVFEPQTHEEHPYTKPLEDMVRTMNQASDAEFAGAMAQYLDLKAFLTHLALENFLGESDGIMGGAGARNFDLYNFDKKNLFTFIVWDKDNTFWGVDQPILRGDEKVVLIRRALAVPELRAHYFEALLKCAAWAGEKDGWLDQQLARWFEQIREAAFEDKLKQCPSDFNVFHTCTNPEVEAEVARMRAFLQKRAESVRTQVAEGGYAFRDSAPNLNPGGAVSGAPGVAGLAPGSIATLYAGFPGLNDVVILINGFPAMLFFLSPAQANFQVPWEVPTGTVSLTAQIGGVPGKTITAEVAQCSPGIFVVTHADGAPITVDRPAGAGEVLIAWATGLGPVTAPVASGQPSPPGAQAVESVTITIGGQKADIDFAGLTPGSVGLYQINVRMPAGLPAGATSLVLSAGGQQAPAVNLVAR